jgi:myo-inositol-1(or 4)-monophosphatase
MRRSCQASDKDWGRHVKGRNFLCADRRALCERCGMTHFADAAEEAARAAGELLCQNFQRPRRVNQALAHDIKLAIDVEAQELITRILLDKFPQHALYGEEGIVGDQSSTYQWVVDPLDGTVNYFYGIPHFCVSIALRCEGEVIVGIIFDPIREEVWRTEKGRPAMLNGTECRVSDRAALEESVVSVGLSKTGVTIDAAMPVLQDMVHRARKCRLLGSAALDLAYVACGRFDAYIEQGVSLWDIAAGWILIENAGGSVEVRPRTDLKDKYSVIASNGVIELGL